MANGRIFAIGDIHGCPDELETLLEAVRPGKGDTLCFLGDYVDRGPASRDVVDLLLELAKGRAECVFLRGNHEDMLLDFVGRGGRFGEAYLENGGSTTLRSYGLAPRRDPDLDQMLPAEHLEFFENLQLVWDVGRSFCVHAGVRPTLPLDEQREEDLMWIREDFFGRSHSYGKVVLYGHTPRRAVEIAPPYRIGLDTGLVYGGYLSCLELGERVLWQVARHSRALESRSIVAELGDLRLA
jgi:serine/threonine protein phosphatase 1